MRALLGLGDFVTNVNIPNIGQIPNLPFGAVVETNAHFCADTVQPVLAGPLPASIYPLVTRICGIQEMISEAAAQRDMGLAFQAFALDPNMPLGLDDAKALFAAMRKNTSRPTDDVPRIKPAFLCQLALTVELQGGRPPHLGEFKMKGCGPAGSGGMRASRPTAVRVAAAVPAGPKHKIDS